MLSRLKLPDAAVAGPCYLLSAALFFAMVDICIKLVGEEFSPWSIVFYQNCGGIIIMQMIFGRRRSVFQGNDIRLLILRGLVGALAFLAVVTAIRILPVSTAMFIVFTYPAFSAVFSFLLLKEGINRYQLCCLATGLLGAGVFFDFSLAGNLVGQIIALVGGILSGLAMTLIQKLRQNDDSQSIYLYFCLGCTLLTAPKFMADPVVPATLREGAVLGGIIVFTLFAQILMNQGMRYCRGWEGGVFLSCEVVCTAVIGISFLGDPINWRFWLGGSLILASVTLINRLR